MALKWFKYCSLKWVLVFLHCDKCIKTLLLSYQTQHLTNLLFFTIGGGGSFDLGGQKVTQHGKKRLKKKFKQKNINLGAKWYKKMGGTSCVITCGVIGTLYCTVLYCTVLYCTVLYCTVLYCTVLYCTVLPCTRLYWVALDCTRLYCVALACTRLYRVVL